MTKASVAFQGMGSDWTLRMRAAEGGRARSAMNASTALEDPKTSMVTP